MDVPALQMLDERVVAFVLGNDVKAAGGAGQRGAAQVIGEGKIERVPAGGGQPHQLHGGGVLPELFNDGDIELLFFRSQQQGEVDGLAPDNLQVEAADVFKINQD